MRLSIVVSVQEASFEAVAFKGGFTDHIKRIAELGFQGVELAVRNPLEVDRGLIIETTNKHKLDICAIGTGQAYGEEGLSLSSAEKYISDAAVARLKDHLRMAKSMRAFVIIGLIRGKAGSASKKQEAINRFANAMRSLDEYARGLGVQLVIEPINRYETDLLPTVSECLDFINANQLTNTGILLDTFHANIEEADIYQSILDAGNKLWHVHVADSNRWAPGYGHIDFLGIVDTLREIGYQGYLSAEILPYPDPIAAAEMTIETMRSLLEL